MDFRLYVVQAIENRIKGDPIDVSALSPARDRIVGLLDALSVRGHPVPPTTECGAARRAAPTCQDGNDEPCVVRKDVIHLEVSLDEIDTR